MPIHFTCSNCGKALFAQEHYAGRTTTCPACKARNTIPLPAPLQATVPSDPLLIDMERGPNVAPAQRDEHEQEVRAEVPPAPPSPLPAAPVQPETVRMEADTIMAASEPTRKCPMCAETIKAAARKCRFCGTILDDTLKTEEEAKRRHDAAALALALSTRAVNGWRTASIIFTRITAFWLIFLTVSAATSSADDLPWLLIAFNIPLIICLLWTSRQMRLGPQHVFLAAGCAILACMPLDFALGLPMGAPSPENFKAAKDMFPKLYENVTQDQYESMQFTFQTLMFSAIGFIFSLPLWITSVKVAALQRLRSSLGGGK